MVHVVLDKEPCFAEGLPFTLKNNEGPVKLKSHDCSNSTAEYLELPPGDNAVTQTLKSLKALLQADRLSYVRGKIDANVANVLRDCSELQDHAFVEVGTPQGNSTAMDLHSQGGKGLLLRSQVALVIFRDASSQESIPSGGGFHVCPKLSPRNFEARKVFIEDIVELEAVKKIPPYTAWIFVERNERMAENQSVAGRRRISYESNGKETFFCQDEDDAAVVRNLLDFKFSKAQDVLLWKTVRKHGSAAEVLGTISEFLRLPEEKVKGRLKILRKEAVCNTKLAAFTLGKDIQVPAQGLGGKSVAGSGRHTGGRYRSLRAIQKEAPDKKQKARSLEDHNKGRECTTADKGGSSESALSSFNSLFCRRCLLFNCQLHGCFQTLIDRARGNDEQFMLPDSSFEFPNPDAIPCSPDCFYLVSKSSATQFGMASETVVTSNELHLLGGKPQLQFHSSLLDTEEGVATSMQVQAGELEVEVSLPILVEDADSLGEHHTSPPAQKRDHLDETVILGNTRHSASGSPFKNEVKIASGVFFGSIAERHNGGSEFFDSRFEEFENSLSTVFKRDDSGIISVNNAYDTERERVSASVSREDDTEKNDEYPLTENSSLENGMDRAQVGTCSPVDWNMMEKDLCEKGVQIFGRNSCLIAKNILKGWKTCKEIAEYITHQSEFLSFQHSDSVLGNANLLANSRTTSLDLKETESIRQPKTGVKRKIRFGRKKAVPKSAVPAIWRKVEGKGDRQLCKHFTPCSCEGISGCGKECPCVRANTYCEKYCGCYKACKNRFRGCQCAKSQCESRHCPCFAANRECDPDVCRFCWIDCGENTEASSDTQACHNMVLLNRKKKRILLAYSDVSGWGVFARHTLFKNDFIGEYTGELISHNEADRRGRVYDRETSFLFNLNDKLVVDAFRKGDKLKFANHSSRKPNCYTKIIMVRGDHRVGIFAKECIQAGEELFYDYQYEPDTAPNWAAAGPPQAT